MLIKFERLVEKYQVVVNEVLHVGAHLAEEADEYFNCGDPRVIWVEANPEVMPKIRERIAPYKKQFAINCLITDADDEVRLFNVTNYDGMSSSVFEFDRHPMYSPDTVFVDRLELPTKTIDTLCSEYDLNPDMLCLDIQGAEMLAFRGATRILKKINWIYTEVSTASVYAGGAQMHEIDAFLHPNFVRVETDLGMHGNTHGDSFYIRV